MQNRRLCRRFGGSNRRLGLPSIALALLVWIVIIRAVSPQSPDTVDFETEIFPIFEHSCFECHGPKATMAQLRLDSRTTVFSERRSGTLIDPGNPIQSVLYQRVAGLNGLERMPFGGKLEPSQVELISTWIEQGAVWPDDVGTAGGEIQYHWAFSAPLRPDLPKVRQADWPLNEVDRFVLARLEEEGLSPSPRADRVTLIRRLSLDLIGLPPTIEEVERFLADTEEGAYQRLVERLLASPHYGERWARVWLDAARYADSNGYEKDTPRNVWPFRDWVITSLNRDLPYDQFIIQQLAGDLLPSPTQDQLVATGFLRNSMINQEGGIDPEQFRMEAMFDRMDTIGKGILGITIQCAQCHNHKFDPLSQKEYYRLFAFLNNCDEASIPVYSVEEEARRTDVLSRMERIETQLKEQNPEWQQEMLSWEADATWNQPNWEVLQLEVDEISTGGERLLDLGDGSLLAQGSSPIGQELKLRARTEIGNITGFRLELMTDPNLPLDGPGRSFKGLAALTEFSVKAAPIDQPEQAHAVAISSASADIDLPGRPQRSGRGEEEPEPRVTGPIEFAIDGNQKTAWGIDMGPGRRNQGHQAVFVASEPLSNPAGTLLTFELSQQHGVFDIGQHESFNLGRFRLSVTTSPHPVADPIPSHVRELLFVPFARRTPQERNEIFSYWRTTRPEWRSANDQIEQLWAGYPEGSSQLVLRERDHQRETHILERGDFLKPQEAVTPGVPAFLHPFAEGLPMNRLGLARWLVDPRAPTTARSIVNRVWQSYFGAGLVTTSEDFGTRGAPPSHPGLLDWLSVELVEKGWSLKNLHRTIVTSATYQQSSLTSPALLEKDPLNVLLARAPRFRVDAEIVRDITLAASGLLNPQLGGPSVFPPAPQRLFQPPASFEPKVWNEDRGEDRYRRSLYTFRYRSVPYPVLQVFDAPSGESACVRRPRSNTPLQSLATLNEPLAMEAARSLAVTTLEKGGQSDRARARFAFRRCLAREPEAEEIEVLLSLLERQNSRLAEGWLNPWAITGFQPSETSSLPAHTTPVQVAAWTIVSRVLLNLDETITRE